jgi:hypothetical protein
VAEPDVVIAIPLCRHWIPSPIISPCTPMFGQYTLIAMT